MPAKIDWSFTSLEEIAKLYYVKLWKVSKIADYLGVSEHALTDYMVANGLPLRGHNVVHNASKGPACPQCGSQESKIIHVWPAESKKRTCFNRTRMCLKCETRFYTREYSVNELRKLCGRRDI